MYKHKLNVQKVYALFESVKQSLEILNLQRMAVDLISVQIHSVCLDANRGLDSTSCCDLLKHESKLQKQVEYKNISLYKSAIIWWWLLFLRLRLTFDSNQVTWGHGYLTSLGLLLGALVLLCSPGPWGTGRGPLGNSWFRRSQGRLRELCGEKTIWGALPWEVRWLA